MRRKSFTNEQIAFARRQAPRRCLGGRFLPENVCVRANVLAVEEAVRRHGDAGDPPAEALENENSKLKRLVADLKLDRSRLRQVLK